MKERGIARKGERMLKSDGNNREQFQRLRVDTTALPAYPNGGLWL